MVKIKSMEQNACTQNNVNNLLISATAGSLIGATTALLLAPKSGKKLRNDIYKTYEDLAEKGQDLYEDVSETASDYAENIKESASNIFGSNHSSNPNLLLGAIGGGVLGLATVLFLLKSNNKGKLDIGLLNKLNAAQKYARKNSPRWIEAARDVLDTINSKVHQNGSSKEEDADEQSTLHDVMDLASAGFKIWQNIKNRR